MNTSKRKRQNLAGATSKSKKKSQESGQPNKPDEPTVHVWGGGWNRGMGQQKKPPVRGLLTINKNFKQRPGLIEKPIWGVLFGYVEKQYWKPSCVNN